MTDRRGTKRTSAWIGQHGEKIAAAWLRAHHCRILATNFRAPRGGEVDIIARDGKVLLFIEVKTRTGHPNIRPLAAVDKTKQSLIEKGANAWLRKLGTRQLPWRFDVVEIHLKEGQRPQVNHIRNAF